MFVSLHDDIALDAFVSQYQHAACKRLQKRKGIEERMKDLPIKFSSLAAALILSWSRYP